MQPFMQNEYNNFTFIWTFIVIDLWVFLAKTGLWYYVAWNSANIVDKVPIFHLENWGKGELCFLLVFFLKKLETETVFRCLINVKSVSPTPLSAEPWNKNEHSIFAFNH